jgi:hypothetical protein
MGLQIRNANHSQNESLYNIAFHNLVAELQKEINELIERLNILKCRIDTCCTHQFLKKILLRQEWHRDRDETVDRLQTIVIDLLNIFEIPKESIVSMASVPENNIILHHDSFEIHRLNFELHHMTMQLIKEGFIRQTSRGKFLDQTIPSH